MMPSTKIDNVRVDFTTGTNLVSETRFNCTGFNHDIKVFFDLLRESKTTGKLEIHLHQGGIQRATLMESTPVDLQE